MYYTVYLDQIFWERHLLGVCHEGEHLCASRSLRIPRNIPVWLMVNV